MPRTVRKSRLKQAPLSEIKDDLSRILRETETQEIITTRHGKPAGMLSGIELESKDDRFEYQLERALISCGALSRRELALRAGCSVRLEDIKTK